MIAESELLVVWMVQGAAKVSLMMIGQQAIMDAYLCLLHLTAGILVGMNPGPIPLMQVSIISLDGQCQSWAPGSLHVTSISFGFTCSNVSAE